MLREIYVCVSAVAMVVSGSGSESDHASLCSNVYAMKHCLNYHKFHTHKA